MVKNKITQKQTQGLKHKNTILHRMIHLDPQAIEQNIIQKMSQNPALVSENEEDELKALEPSRENDEWNQDFDKPIDEYETGDFSKETNRWEIDDISNNLEQAGIQLGDKSEESMSCYLTSVDHYRVHGGLPEDADSKLFEELMLLNKSTQSFTLPSIYPTFEVDVEDGNVEAIVLPLGQNLRFVSKLGQYSSSAKNFTRFLNDRIKVLSYLANLILVVLQGDFFRQKDLNSALRFLIPVKTKKLSRYIENPLKIGRITQFLSKLGDHLVFSPFGIFPLNFFIPEKAQLVRLWFDLAEKEGKVTNKEKTNWIRDQINQRIKQWELTDIRHEFIAPLKDITMNDIKYVRTVIKC